MKTKQKKEIGIDGHRLLGSFIGTLEGICIWNIPEELKLKLQKRIEELREINFISSSSHVLGCLTLAFEALREARPFVVEKNIGFDMLAGEVIKKIDEALEQEANFR